MLVSWQRGLSSAWRCSADSGSVQYKKMTRSARFPSTRPSAPLRGIATWNVQPRSLLSHVAHAAGQPAQATRRHGNSTSPAKSERAER